MRTSSAEPVKRIPYPNSAPRHLKLFGFGRRAEDLVRQLAEAGFPSLREINEGEAGQLPASTNTVIAILDRGTDLDCLERIFAQTAKRGILMTAVLLTERNAGPEAGDAWFSRLRASADMLVVTSDQDYPRELVESLVASQAMLHSGTAEPE